MGSRITREQTEDRKEIVRLLFTGIEGNKEVVRDEEVRISQIIINKLRYIMRFFRCLKLNAII
jgi:hypothetical protein